MQVRLKDYVITGDAHQFTLNKSSIVKEGKREGEENLTVIGHYPKLEQLADKLFHMEITRSEADNLSDILTVVKATRKLIKSAGWTKEDV